MKRRRAAPPAWLPEYSDALHRLTVLAGLFLVAHGLVHIAVWLAPARPDAPFDSHRSWLLGDARTLSRSLAVATSLLFVVAGILVLASAASGAGVAVGGAAASLVLVLLTFHPWFIAAIAINVAIIVIALS
jgi:hypothetical protein